MKKHKKDKGKAGDRLVYTTHPGESNAFFNDLNFEEPDMKHQPTVYVYLDRKKRRGKEVTCIEGVRRHPEGLKDLANTLKTSCGAGGSVKDGVILIQGNHVERIVKLLKNEGLSQIKIKGGY